MIDEAEPAEVFLYRGGVQNHRRRRALHCVPSNVTLRLRELEESLGGELFFRDKNRLYVNPKGDCSISRRATLWRRRSAASSCSPASISMGC